MTRTALGLFLASLGTAVMIVACAPPTTATPGGLQPPGPPRLVWHPIDERIDTTCTPWGDRLYRHWNSSSGYNIAVAPNTTDDDPCGPYRQPVDYGPGAIR